MSDTAWITLGTIVAWLATALLCAGLLGDWVAQRIRSLRGRALRRCPKCWYDMSHAPPPGLTCSECGYLAKREREFYNARKKWKLVGLGLLLVISGYAVRVSPAVQKRGWPGAIPTTALIIVAPWVRADASRVGSRFMKPPPPLTWQDRLVVELEARLYTGKWPRWQRRFLLRRCVSPGMADSRLTDEVLAMAYRARQIDDAELVSIAGELVRIWLMEHSRVTWPVASPIYITPQIKLPFASKDLRVRFIPRTEGLSEFIIDSVMKTQGMTPDPSKWWWMDSHVGVLPSNKRSIQYDAQIEWNSAALAPSPAEPRWVPVLIKAFDPGVSVQGAIDDYITLVRHDEVVDAIRKHLKPVVHQVADALELEIPLDSPMIRNAISKWPGVQLSVDIALIADGLAVAHGKAFWRWETYGGAFLAQFIPEGMTVPMDVTPDSQSLRSVKQWQVRLRSDPANALRLGGAKECFELDLLVPATTVN